MSNDTPAANPASTPAVPALTGPDVNAAAAAVSRAMQGLAQTIAATTDPDRRASLEQALSDLQDSKAQINTADLARATAAVAAASVGLQAVVDGARTDPGAILISKALDELKRLTGRTA
ncbi:hypothetical protein [Azospirillum halopraeferens]|uniref:hypothetical protein n=1 Tax=Azospirillum halopraeferens TaxID=34010 RepID=UPI00048E48D9|nr:hypothetical protein [Azospirillum halopraeferens]